MIPENIQQEMEQEYNFPEPCEKQVSSKYNIHQLIINAQALRDYNQLLGMPIPQPGTGKNWQKNTKFKCTTKDGNPNGSK